MSNSIEIPPPIGPARFAARLFAAFFLLGASGAGALADDGQHCTNAMLRSLGQVTRIQAMGMDNCATRAGRGEHASADEIAECLQDMADTSSRNAQALTVRRALRYCEPAPSLGFTDAGTVTGRGRGWELEMAVDVFGLPAGDALRAGDGESAKARCQRETLRGYQDLREAWVDGMVLGVRRYSISSTPWTASGLTGVLTGSFASSLYRVAKAEARVLSNVMLDCEGLLAAEVFPGRCAEESTPQDLAGCIIERARCRTCRMAEASMGVAIDCERLDDGQSNGTCPAEAAACGNGSLEDGEACDSSDLAGQTCTGLGFAAGTLACSAACGLDTSGCTNCGNGDIDDGEQCEGSDLAEATCSSIGFQTGDLACTDQCRFETAGCTFCGDGWIGGVEECDGTNLAGRSCQSEGRDGGTLTCTDSCRLDASDCFSCGDGKIDPSEQCDGSELAGRTCADLGFVAGDLTCDASCHHDTSGCFETCNAANSPPPGFLFQPDDELILVGDSVTFAFLGNRDHYGRIFRKILGSTYCDFAETFRVRAYGLKGAHYASYPRIVKQVLSANPAGEKAWVMFQDAGKSETLADDRFQNAVRQTAATTRAVAPGARVLFTTTPPLEEQPERRGTCRIYRRQCNYTAHNDILTWELGPETGSGVVPWSADFCRLIHHRLDPDALEFTTDGIHPRAAGNLALALSTLKWAGVPREHLVLTGLDELHPSLTAHSAALVADWIYSPETYDCSQVNEPCAEAEHTCASYLEGMAH